MPQIQARLAHPPRPDPEAYALYLRGRFFYEKDTVKDLLRAVDLYKQAIKKDPGFAPPYSGLGVVYLQLEALRALPARTAYPQAETAAKKATLEGIEVEEQEKTLDLLLEDQDLEEEDLIKHQEKLLEALIQAK